MDKRGQFFILGAMILMLALFVLVAKVNTYEEKILLEDFPELTSNYKEEAPRVINDALLNNENPTNSIEGFTESYIAYARTIDPNLGIVYAYKNPLNGEILIKNYGNKEINVANNDLYPTKEETLNNINLDLGGTNFKTTIPTKLNVYGKGYNEAILKSGEKVIIEIDGILYPMDLIKNDLQIVANDKSADGTRIDIA
jgi:hypothetical protein